MRVGTFDIETDGLLPEVSKVHCAVVKDHADGSAREFTPENVHQLCDYLDTFDVLIGHNSIFFDFPVLRKVFGWDFKGTKVDTLLMSRLQRPKRISPKGSTAGPHSVESWGVRLGHPKVENEIWDEWSPHMQKRCREDVEIQYDIYHALIEEGRGEGWADAHKLNHKVHHYLQLQEEYGWTVDEKLLDYSLYMLQRWMDKISAALQSYLPIVVEIKEAKKDGEYGYLKKPFKKNGELSVAAANYISDSSTWDIPNGYVGGPFSRVSFRRIDLDKNKEVKEFLLELGWEPMQWNYNNGKRTSAKLDKDDPFHGIQGSLGKLITRRVQCKQRLGTMRGWKDAVVDGRIHASVAGIASTARLRHKLIVNVPSVERQSFFSSWMRKVFVASPGMVMVGVDSAGNQMRQLAARMQDETFTNAVLHGNSADGTDLHSVNQRLSGAKTRVDAKSFFYGFIFGAQAPKIGKIINGTKEEGQRLIDNMLSNLPGLRRLIDELTDEWRGTAQRYYDPSRGQMVYRNGYITGIDGRPVLVESEHAVLCYVLQSDEAIQMAIAYVMVHKWAEQKGWVLHKDWAMLCWYHDEFQMECRPGLADELQALAEKAIAWAGEFLNIDCPHEGTGNQGMSWYECH